MGSTFVQLAIYSFDDKLFKQPHFLALLYPSTIMPPILKYHDQIRAPLTYWLSEENVENGKKYFSYNPNQNDDIPEMYSNNDEAFHSWVNKGYPHKINGVLTSILEYYSSIPEAHSRGWDNSLQIVDDIPAGII